MGLAGIKPVFRLVANGTDITDIINDRLISLNYSDSVGMESDTLDIELADDVPLDPIKMPPTGAELELFMGYDQVTQHMGLFVVDEIELSGWPGKMNIRARAAIFTDTKEGKEAMQTQKTRSWTAGTKFGDLIKRIASEHNLKYAVADKIATIVLPHIDQVDESDLNLLLRIARKYDAVVKPFGGYKFAVTKAGDMKTATGKDLPVVYLDAGDCTAFRMTSQRKENAGTVVAKYQLTRKATRYEVKVGTGEPVKRIGKQYPTKEIALAAAKAELAKRQRDETTVSVSMPGDQTVAAECKLVLSGFRDGVNGEWLIKRADHRLDEGSGYTTDIEATKPNDEEEPEVEVVERKKPTPVEPDDPDGPGNVIEDE